LLNAYFYLSYNIIHRAVHTEKLSVGISGTPLLDATDELLFCYTYTTYIPPGRFIIVYSAQLALFRMHNASKAAAAAHRASASWCSNFEAMQII
jgi:hypothetical protein